MGRSDGVRVKDVPNYRKIMPFFMRTKQESVIYYYLQVPAEKAVEFAEKKSAEYGIKVSPFHLVLHSIYKTHVAYPDLNRFVKGGVLWQRKGIWLSFSIKKQFTTKSAISIVKREFKDGFTLKDTIISTTEDTKNGRDMKKRDQAEKESSLYNWIPAPIKKSLYPAYKFMDEYGFLPASYVKKDPLYASVFVANVGAFEADTGYHHLYELGTIPMFLVIGKVCKKPVVENDRVVPRLVIPIKATADERVVDGFYYYRALDYFKDQLLHPERLLEAPELVE
jgi:hypothetical protein